MSTGTNRPWNMDVNVFCMLMHLSQFTSAIVPGLGFALPVIMWATNKSEFKAVDDNGKNIINWLISVIIYYLVAYVLHAIGIGVLIFIIVALCQLAFAIIGAIKAYHNQAWRYPLSIRFLKD